MRLKESTYCVAPPPSFHVNLCVHVYTYMQIQGHILLFHISLYFNLPVYYYWIKCMIWNKNCKYGRTNVVMWHFFLTYTIMVGYPDSAHPLMEGGGIFCPSSYALSCLWIYYCIYGICGNSFHTGLSTMTGSLAGHVLYTIMWCVTLSGWVLPYLGMVVRVPGNDPHFGGDQSDWVPILYLHTIWLIPSFCRKNRFVSITFSSRDTKT